MNGRPLPQHGTRARYLRGCHCGPCSAEHSRYCKQWTNTTYKDGKLRVDPGPAADHVRELLAAGWSCRQIGEAAGVSHTRISALSRNVYGALHRDLALKVLAAHPTAASSAEKTYVDATGTRRRIQALAAIGHTFAAIGNEVGITKAGIGRITWPGHDRVQASTARAIAELYQRWSRTPGASAFSRTWARKHNWHGPLDWDDIDNPAEQPDTSTPANSLNAVELAAERGAEIQHLARLKTHPSEIGRQLGMTEASVRKHLSRKHHTLYLELTA